MQCSILYGALLIRDRIVWAGAAPDPVSATHRDVRCAAHGM